MSLLKEDTIVALASAPGRAGVAVVRVSGPQTADVLQKICRTAKPVEPRYATMATILSPKTQEIIDHALILYFPAPHSFTGEDVLELHIHGGRAVLRETLDALCSLDKVRPADAGEFSRRAFENGKMDLTEAEGIADLVDAETTAQRRQALRQMEGVLGDLYAGWAERIKNDLAYIEAEIDFADEDVPPDLTEGRREDIRALSEEIAAHLNDNHRGERLREGFMVAILGEPNAGKSRLLNALARREAAIVSPIPGTTRDVVEVQMDLGGYPVSLADTAGLRETADVIESEGVKRALARAEKADLKLLVFNGAHGGPALDPATMALADENSIIIINKKDQIFDPDVFDLHATPSQALFISAKTGEGLDVLEHKITEEIERRFVSSDQPALTRARHRKALEECLAHLRRALDAPESELCAEDMRLAIRAIGQITGRVDVEDILDVIFSSFCIGK